jgi:hypothetical protein
MKRINIVYCAGSIESFEVLEGEVPEERAGDILTYQDTEFPLTLEQVADLLISNLCQPREVALATPSGPVPEDIMHAVQLRRWADA